MQNHQIADWMYSEVWLPQAKKPYPSLLDWLCSRFPHVAREIWRERLDTGKIIDDKGDPLSQSSPYLPHTKIRYLREVPNEPLIPFREKIIYRDAHLLVVDKPHFLPIAPTGNYLHQTCLYRLRAQLDLPDLVPLHRLDRETAGLVLFSINPNSRDAYHGLFRKGDIDKTYRAVGRVPDQPGQFWSIKSRIIKGKPWCLMKAVEGEPNAESEIKLQTKFADRAQFEIRPITGKQHQIRLHLGSIGAWIINDSFYPKLEPYQNPPDFTKPLQLLAWRLAFQDPISGNMRDFKSTLALELWD